MRAIAHSRTPVAHMASLPELTSLAFQAFLIAKDAAFNVRDYLENSSPMALVTAKHCEQELDRLERTIDESLPDAIAHVAAGQARALLAALKLITDLERIGDLVVSVVECLQSQRPKLSREDRQDMLEMAGILEQTLDELHAGFLQQDSHGVSGIMATEGRMDELRRQIFQRHLLKRDGSVNVLLMAQAFERAGDHVKNLAEELVHFVEHRSMRHAGAKRQRGE